MAFLRHVAPIFSWPMRSNSAPISQMTRLVDTHGLVVATEQKQGRQGSNLRPSVLETGSSLVGERVRGSSRSRSRSRNDSREVALQAAARK